MSAGVTCDLIGAPPRGDWEGDFVKGAANAGAIGTLVERKSRYTLIAKMKDSGGRGQAAGQLLEAGHLLALIERESYSAGKLPRRAVEPQGSPRTGVCVLG
jgi:transposase, IS30 family